jgi:hypothetical protein
MLPGASFDKLLRCRRRNQDCTISDEVPIPSSGTPLYILGEPQ